MKCHRRRSMPALSVWLPQTLVRFTCELYVLLYSKPGLKPSWL